VPKGLYSLRDRGNGTVLAAERFSCAGRPGRLALRGRGARPRRPYRPRPGRPHRGRRGGELRVEVRSGAWEDVLRHDLFVPNAVLAR